MNGNKIGLPYVLINYSKFAAVIAPSKSFLFSSNDLNNTTFPYTECFSAASAKNVWAKVTLSLAYATLLNVSKSLSSDDVPKNISNGVDDTLSKNFSKSSTEFNSVDGGPDFFVTHATISLYVLPPS